MKKKMLKYLIFLGACVWSILSHACDCNEQYSVAQDYKNSSLVAKIVVIDKAPIREKIMEKEVPIFRKLLKDSTIGPDYEMIRKYKYTAIVINPYKVDQDLDTIFITTGLGSGDCGYSFDLEQEYILYAGLLEKEDFKNYQTNICYRTRLFDKREEKQILEQKNK